MEPRIRRLDDQVVHKIAAGEIIISPANALKELLENSIDSGATNIEVIAKEGGFKLLQVTDNGSGIGDEDLEILCERFTTSKIQKYADLSVLQTLGFRGEALASISHVAHLAVRTKTKDQKVALRAEYQDGKMLNKKPLAGVSGTQIAVEDLFYNMPSRTAALKHRKREEYQKILDVVTRYAILYPASFSCKQFGDPQPLVINGATSQDKIRKIFGASVAQDLVDLAIPSHPNLGLESVNGFVTNIHYESKKSIGYIFFVNNRLVSCKSLQRGIQRVYAANTPKGNAFVFLSLKIASPNVDVNMHPTKQEVKFLYEPEIAELICATIEGILTTQEQDGKKYKTQSLFLSTSVPADGSPVTARSITVVGKDSLSPRSSERPRIFSGFEKRPAHRYEHKLVRTDPKQQTLTSLSRPSSQIKVLKARTPESAETGATQRPKSNESDVLASDKSDENSMDIDAPAAAMAVGTAVTAREPKNYNLASVAALKANVISGTDQRLLKLFSNHTCVGLVDNERGLAAVQHDVRLYLVDYREVATSFFYQRGLADFGNFGTITLTNSLPVRGLLEVATDSDASRLYTRLAAYLNYMTPMLADYFNIKLEKVDDDWNLVQFPLLLENYQPFMGRLPTFVVSLAELDYDDEVRCLDGVLWALAILYTPAISTNDGVEMLFQNFKVKFLPPKSLEPAVVEIASLPGLYKVFERC